MRRIHLLRSVGGYKRLVVLGIVLVTFNLPENHAGDPTGQVCNFNDKVGATSSDSTPSKPSIENGRDQLLLKEIARATERLAKSPSDSDMLVLRGAAHLQLGMLNKAEADLASAVKLAPQDRNAWWSYGAVFLISGRDAKALPCYEKAITLGLQEARAFTEQGIVLSNLGKFEEAIACYTSALDVNPDFVGAVVNRAEIYDRTGKWQEAIEDCSTAIMLAPKMPYFYGLRGTIRLDHQQYHKGVADVWQAIQTNPNDAGANYQPLTDRALSPESIQHGEEQVRRMLRDRPVMAQHIIVGDKLWTWTVRKFAGEDIGSLIVWDSSEPRGGMGDSSILTAEGHHSNIRVANPPRNVSKDHTLDFDELWSTAVTELHNLVASPLFKNISDQVLRNKMSKEEFIVSMLQTEILSVQRTRAFYLKVYLPWMRNENVNATSADNWYCSSALSAMYRWILSCRG